MCRIDPKCDIESQGRFDLIVHKPLKYIAEKMETGREPVALKNISEYERSNPHIFLDPLESIETLGDRNKLLTKLKEFRTENGLTNLLKKKNLINTKQI